MELPITARSAGASESVPLLLANRNVNHHELAKHPLAVQNIFVDPLGFHGYSRGDNSVGYIPVE